MPNKNGLEIITPTSVTVDQGSASISANGSVTFTSIYQLRLNGIFSSTYDNYMIVMRSQSSNSSSGTWQAALRSGTTDNRTASSYVNQNLTADGASVSGSRGSGDLFDFGYFDNWAGYVMNIYGPFLAQPTAMRVYSQYNHLSPSVVDFACTHNQSTSYNGINLMTPFSGALVSGRVTVYGMRN